MLSTQSHGEGFPQRLYLRILSSRQTTPDGSLQLEERIHTTSQRFDTYHLAKKGNETAIHGNSFMIRKLCPCARDF